MIDNAKLHEYEKLVDSLRGLPRETEWVEFKHNNDDPEKMGKNISALANSAALHAKDHAYVVWGISDELHELIGTSARVEQRTVGGEELENWLRRMLSDNADFMFNRFNLGGKDIVLLRIRPAFDQPVRFKNLPYIRVGSCTQLLHSHPMLEKRLWSCIQSGSFETQVAAGNLTLSEALERLDYDSYFRLLEISPPQTVQSVAHYLLKDQIIVEQASGLYAVTNLGAILFAKHLDVFPSVAQKDVRLVQYQGNSRTRILKDYTLSAGYAVEFEKFMHVLDALVPSLEDMKNPMRTIVPAYPPLALREVVANALIHQDFDVRGLNVRVEVFDNRVEVTNAGTPLIDRMRIIGDPPKSRNPLLAGLMRRFGYCEELGRGWDRIASEIEEHQLPAPQIIEYDDASATKIVISSRIPYKDLSKEERLWACYLHACSEHVERSSMTNASLRRRFGLQSTASSAMSRLIKSAIEENLIKPLDAETSHRLMRYVPYWAE